MVSLPYSRNSSLISLFSFLPYLLHQLPLKMLFKYIWSPLTSVKQGFQGHCHLWVATCNLTTPTLAPAVFCNVSVIFPSVSHTALLFSFKAFTCFSWYLDHYSEPVLWPVGSYTCWPCLPSPLFLHSFCIHHSRHASSQGSSLPPHSAEGWASGILLCVNVTSSEVRETFPHHTSIVSLAFIENVSNFIMYHVFLIVC